MRIEIQMRIQIQFRFESVKGNTDKRQAAGGKRDMLTVPAAQHNIQHTTYKKNWPELAPCLGNPWRRHYFLDT